MESLKNTLSSISFGILVVSALAFSGCTSDANKAAVQKSMSDYIAEKSTKNEGKYDIKGESTAFDYIHDGVSKKDGLHVSCADFKLNDDVYDIDYYVKEEGEEFTVVKEVLHKKNGEEVNEVLWEK